MEAAKKFDQPQVIYLVGGVSGAGKSWACRQVTEKFHYIPHDRCWAHPERNSWDPSQTWAAGMGDDSCYLPGAKSTHLEVLLEAAFIAERPILTECPFGERPLREALEEAGIPVVPVFVIEDPEVVAERYENREGEPLPKAAHTRARTIVGRAQEWGAFYGTSDEVLEHLRELDLSGGVE